MDIILLENVEKVGGKHEVVSVKPGYGRNYLIPQGLAVLANSSNLSKLNELRRQEEARARKTKDEAEALSEKLQSQVFKVGAKTGTSDKIFGSVTSIQLSNLIKEKMDLEIDRKKIEILEDVKTLGTYHATVDLHPEVQTQITFEVVGE